MRQRASKQRRFQINVFWQFFASFFVLILLPSTIACLFMYIYVVQLMEREVEQSGELLIAQFAEQTDKLIASLQDEMIVTLGHSPELNRYLQYVNEPRDNPTRIDLTQAVMERITAISQNHPLVQSAYLYHVNSEHVIGSGIGYIGQDNYFTYLNHYADVRPDEWQEMFTGRQIMTFTRPLRIENKQIFTNRTLSSGQYVSAVMSYPFHTERPEVYLVANIDVLQLQKLIHMDRSDAIDFAIVDKAGHILAYEGDNDAVHYRISASFRTDAGNLAELQVEDRAYRIVYNESDLYDWYYVSIFDLENFLKPAELIRKTSVVLLLFFLVVGGILSYVMSKRMYSPIRAIKQGLATIHRHGGKRPGRLPEENDFELIKQWSDQLITEHKDMSARIQGMSPVMHEYFLSKVLLGEFRDSLSIVYYAREIGFDAKPSGSLAVLCTEIHFREKAGHPLTVTDKSFLTTDLKQRIEKSVEGTVWQCMMSGDMLACVVHLTQGDAAELLAIARLIRDELSAQRVYYHAAIGVGNVVHEVQELHVSYRQALQQLRRRSLHPEVQICMDEDRDEDSSALDGFLAADKVGQMLNLYRAGKYGEIQKFVDQRLDEAIYSNASVEAVKRLCVDILNTWLRAVSADPQNDFSIESYAALYQRLSGCVTGDEIRLFFLHTAQELFRVNEDPLQDNPFAEVTAYIRDHYGRDLSIEMFASQLHMSLGHFSRKFKEAVGENFIEFVTRCRMEAAKRLLMDTDLKIEDIALEVGYLGRHSFIKTFRKSESVTPGKYREMYKNAN